MSIKYNGDCRVCIEVAPRTPLYPLTDEDTRQMFQDCTSIEMRLNDGYPQHLCEECYNACVNWWNFKSRALKAESKFLNFVPEQENEAEIYEFEPEDAEGEWEDEEEMWMEEEEEMRQECIAKENENAIEFVDADKDESIFIQQNGELYRIVGNGEDDQPLTEEDPSMEAPMAQEEEFEAAKTLYKCTECLITLSTLSQMKDHLLFHKDTTNFKCELCGKGFVTSGILTSHLRTHVGEKPFKCALCKESFAEKSQLTAHVKAHPQKVKPFQCDQCTKSYNQKRTLLIHQRVHTGEKPFKCKWCHSRFAQTYQLGVHEQKHENGTIKTVRYPEID